MHTVYYQLLTLVREMPISHHQRFFVSDYLEKDYLKASSVITEKRHC